MSCVAPRTRTVSDDEGVNVRLMVMVLGASRGLSDYHMINRNLRVTWSCVAPRTRTVSDDDGEPYLDKT